MNSCASQEPRARSLSGVAHPVLLYDDDDDDDDVETARSRASDPALTHIVIT